MCLVLRASPVSIAQEKEYIKVVAVTVNKISLLQPAQSALS